MHSKVQNFATDFLAEYLSCSVDQKWQRKAATKKNHRPWINPELRRKICRKARFYKKARKSQKAVRKQCSKEILKPKNDYVNEKVMDDLEHGNTKHFLRFIKHLQFDIISIPPSDMMVNYSQIQLKTQVFLVLSFNLFSSEKIWPVYPGKAVNVIQLSPHWPLLKLVSRNYLTDSSPKKPQALIVYPIMSSRNCQMSCPLYCLWQQVKSPSTHWGQNEINNISQATFSNVFSSMKMYEFQLTFPGSLFLGVQLTISQHWFR